MHGAWFLNAAAAVRLSSHSTFGKPNGLEKILVVISKTLCTRLRALKYAQLKTVLSIGMVNSVFASSTKHKFCPLLLSGVMPGVRT